MRYSPEALTAFEAVDSGSFSAAARRLRKSQSTISTAIANLEADLGVTLFDRATRQPTLTPQGEQVLSYVKAILAASERLDELAVSLSGETEPRPSCSPILCTRTCWKICWCSLTAAFLIPSLSV